MHELQHDERFDALRGRSRRRALVVVGYLLLVTAVAVELRGLDEPSR